MIHCSSWLELLLDCHFKHNYGTSTRQMLFTECRDTPQHRHTPHAMHRRRTHLIHNTQAGQCTCAAACETMPFLCALHKHAQTASQPMICRQAGRLCSRHGVAERLEECKDGCIDNQAPAHCSTQAFDQYTTPFTYAASCRLPDPG